MKINKKIELVVPVKKENNNNNETRIWNENVQIKLQFFSYVWNALYLDEFFACYLLNLFDFFFLGFYNKLDGVFSTLSSDPLSGPLGHCANPTNSLRFVNSHTYYICLFRMAAMFGGPMMSSWEISPLFVRRYYNIYYKFVVESNGMMAAKRKL